MPGKACDRAVDGSVLVPDKACGSDDDVVRLPGKACDWAISVAIVVGVTKGLAKGGSPNGGRGKTGIDGCAGASEPFGRRISPYVLILAMRSSEMTTFNTTAIPISPGKA